MIEWNALEYRSENLTTELVLLKPCCLLFTLRLRGAGLLKQTPYYKNVHEYDGKNLHAEDLWFR